MPSYPGPVFQSSAPLITSQGDAAPLIEGEGTGHLAGRPVSCKPSSLTLFDGHTACLLCPSENGKKLQASQVFRLQLGHPAGSSHLDIVHLATPTFNSGFGLMADGFSEHGSPMSVLYMGCHTGVGYPGVALPPEKP